MVVDRRLPPAVVLGTGRWMSQAAYLHRYGAQPSAAVPRRGPACSSQAVGVILSSILPALPTQVHHHHHFLWISERCDLCFFSVCLSVRLPEYPPSHLSIQGQVQGVPLAVMQEAVHLQPEGAAFALQQ